jgi:hypothetical protein
MAAEGIGASDETAAPGESREPTVGSASACAVCQEPLVKVTLSDKICLFQYEFF